MNFKYLLIGFIGLLLISGCQEREFNGAIISTGIIDYKEKSKEPSGFIQRYQLDMNFANLIQFMHSKRTMKFLMYRLLVHDLKSDSNNKESTPFKKIKSQKDFLSNYDVDELIKYMESKLADFNNEEVDEKIENEIQELAVAFGYDYESLIKHLELERIKDSDQLSIEFISSNPGLSYFATTAYCEDFLEYYRHLQTYKFKKNVELFTEIVNERKSLLLTKKEALRVLNTNNPNYAELKYEVSLLEKEYLDVETVMDSAVEKFENTKIPIELIRSATLAKQ